MKALLSLGPFRRLLGGWTIGNLADSALFLTLAVWAKDLTGSSAAAGMVFFALGVPALAVPLLGLLVDRVKRKPLMVAANLFAALAAACLTFVTDAGQMWLLYTVTVVYGALGILNGSALSGLLRDMFADEYLDDANAALTTIDQGLRIFTPLLGAALYVLWGGRALGLGVAILLVITALILLTVRAQESSPEPSGGRMWAETMAGFRHLGSIPILVSIVAVTSVAFGVIGFFDTLIFEVIEQALEKPPAFFGVLATCQGAGSIVGGFTSSRALRAFGPQRAVGISLALLALASTCFALSLRPQVMVPVTIVAITIGGIAIPWMVVALTTTRQRLTPPRLQGRTAAAANLALTVPQIASTAAGATLVTIVPYRVLLFVAAAVLVGCTLTLFASSRRSRPGSPAGVAPAP